MQGREEIYLSWFFHNLSYASYEIPKDALEEYVRAYTQLGALRAGFNYYRAWPQDITELTEPMGDQKLQMPVLTVFRSHPIPRQRPELKWSKHPNADRLRTVATNVSEVLIEKSGHWIPEEQPKALATHLTEFFHCTDSA